MKVGVYAVVACACGWPTSTPPTRNCVCTHKHNILLSQNPQVYIPELDKTFSCPPSFRLFAAQNPTHEGGGRKGLPASFLNRFLRVHVELLTSLDLCGIASAMYPRVGVSRVSKMTSFLARLADHVAVGRLGADGSKGEFNLRDLLRWCLLVCADLNGEGNGEDGEGMMEDGGVDGGEEEVGVVDDAVRRYARMLMWQRMRSQHDRQVVAQTFQEVWF